MSDQQLKSGDAEGRWPAFLLLAFAVAVLGVAAFFLFLPGVTVANADRIAAAGTLVSTLFAGLAFAGVVYAIALQRRELALQRLELAQTREELSQQNETMHLQRFESSLFNLVRSHRDIVTSTRARFGGPDSKAFEGIHAFSTAAGELTGRLIMQISPEPSEERIRSLADTWFREVCYKPEAEFGHYFRALFHILKFISDSKIKPVWPYLLLVRSQLSNPELVLLFCYGLTSDGRGMSRYIEQYHLLRGLRIDPRLEKYRRFYKAAAFGTTSRTKLEEPPELAV